MYGDYENPNNDTMGLRIDTSNNLYVGVVNGSTETKCATPYNISAATWYRVGWVYNVAAGTITGYVNNSAFGSITATPPAALYSSDNPAILTAIVKLTGTTNIQYRWKNGIFFYD